MQVNLHGKVAVVSVTPGATSDAVIAALAANGARVIGAEAWGQAGIDLLVADIDAAASLDALAKLCRDVATDMAERQTAGRIVILISALGVVAAKGRQDRSITDAGASALTRILAMEFGGHGVLVNAVAVGAMDGGPDAALVSHVPSKALATPADVANAVLFLADPANSYMTGHVLAVDGGWSAGYARDF